MQDFRVIDLPERTTLDSSDYTMIDSAENGTNKYLLSRQAAETDAKIATAVGGVEEELNAAVEGIEESITALQGDVETVETTLETKADKDGTYPDMAVGSVLGTNTVTDREPYFIRPSASIGDREFDTLVGGTLGWNQLVKNGNFADTSNWIGLQAWKSYAVDSNVLHLVSTANQAAIANIVQNIASGITPNHVYIILFSIKASKASKFSGSVGTSAGGGSFANREYNADVWTEISSYCKPHTYTDNMLYFRPKTSDDEEEVDIYLKNINLIDLTATFGATIADYIYSLEQATAGAGVAWFRQYFGKDYYPYSAPTLKSVEGLTAHEMVGFNQWDEEVESGYITPETGVEVADPSKIRMKNYMMVLPNTTYYKKTPSSFWNVYYDENKQYIGYGDPLLNRTFTTPSNCHYIRSGFETAYGTTYNHDICINLSDATKNGTYEPYVSHSYPLDSTWVGMGIPKLDSANKLYFDGDTYASDGTVTERFGIRAYQSGDESLADAITDGTNTVYKLTTPTTSSASPFTSPQICDPDGTEEYVSTGVVPVGHETEYVENLADKLTDIPDLPTTAGTYSLKVTVSGGVPSYSWVSA